MAISLENKPIVFDLKLPRQNINKMNLILDSKLKINTICIALLLLPFLGKSQITIKNKSLITSYNNVLYIGIENKIEIFGLTTNQKILFKHSNCEIKKSTYKDNEYIITVKRALKDTLQIIENAKLIFQTNFEILKLERPVCYFEKCSNTNCDNEKIVSNPHLICKIPNCLLNIIINITSFKIAKIVKNDTIE